MTGFNLFAPTLNAQIKIEERVEINSSTAKNNPGMNPSTVYTDSGFIMWKSGYLQVDYNSHFSYLYHYDGPMPAYSSLNTYFLKDNSLKIDALLPRFPRLTVNTYNFIDYCEWQYVERTRYFYYRQSPGLYNIGYVKEGDTVRFSYYSDIVGSGMPYTYEITDASEYSEGWVFDVYQVDTCFYGMGVNGFSILVNIVVLNTLDHFEVTIIPDTLALFDTLAFSETARLYIQAKDSQNNDIELSTDTLLTFKVETNKTYGTFIDANGDTLKTTPAVLDNITYGDANAGLIKFAAVKENPDSFVTCRVKVYLQEDTTKNGEREAVVLEQTLKLIINNPVVEPIITGITYDPEHDTYLNNIRMENRKPFSVKITRGGVPVSNHSIKLKTNYVDGSGGHDHINPRRPDSAFTYQREINRVLTTINVPTERARKQNYGSFYSYSSGETFNRDSLKGMIYERSRQDTVTRFEYVASIWGDQMKIYLRSAKNSLLTDSVEIIERIPLGRLEPNGNLVLIGGRAEHHGPPDYQDDHNHYGINNMITRIENIAEDFRQQLPDEPLLNINDMSLLYGGKFDITGQWKGSHAGHREGRNVDIRSRDMEGDRFLDDNDNGIYDPDPVTNPIEVLLYDGNNNGLYDGETLEIFRHLCRRNRASGILLENPWNHNGYAEHWHLTF